MIKQAIHAAAWRAETVLDRIKGQRDTRRIIEPYIGYATPEHLILRGRVLSGLRRNKPTPDQSKWTNFRQMFALFLTDEVAGVSVEAEGVTAVSDEEGYFTLRLPRDARCGWVDVNVRLVSQETSVICSVLVPQEEAEFAIVSDIDDTMMRTGAYSLARNLWTSFTGNALTREVFADAVTFMDDLSQAGRNPVYYVSSSPWNLHHFLSRIFERAGLARGPKFLRDLGLSKTQFITGTHGDHKGGSIDILAAANPDLPLVLVGDTGQHDAFVYRDAVLRLPDRIAAVVLREPGMGPDAQSVAAMRDIRDAGVMLLSGPDFDGFSETILGRMRAQAQVSRSE